MTALDDLRAAAQRLSELGPYVTRIDLGRELMDTLRVDAHRRVGFLPRKIRSAWNVPLDVVDDLPPYAMRLHWSDGRIVTRYRRAVLICVQSSPFEDWSRWPRGEEVVDLVAALRASVEAAKARRLAAQSVTPRSDAVAPESVTPGNDTPPCG